MSSNNNQELDDTNFPFVKISLGKTLRDEKEFEDITKFWLKQYLKKQDFYMIFDTSRVESIPLSYMYKLGKFTGKLRQLKEQYLKVSILLIKSKFVRGLYSLYMKIQKPISRVYIVSTEEDVQIIVNKLKNQETITEYKVYS